MKTLYELNDIEIKPIPGELVLQLEQNTVGLADKIKNHFTGQKVFALILGPKLKQKSLFFEEATLF